MASTYLDHALYLRDYFCSFPVALPPSLRLRQRMDLLNGDLKRKLHQQLEPYGQTQVLRYWGALNGDQRRHLAAQVESLDLDLLARVYQSGGDQQHWAEQARRAEPPSAVRLHGARELAPCDARLRGEQALRDGKVGMILVAGGQGTRLGFKHPKGMYPIGPVSKRSLFEILISGLRARARRHGRSIPLYIMTSPATHEETVSFLRQHGRFGLADSDLRIFRQGTMPVVDADTGQLLLADKGQLLLSPDGHGGTVAAMDRHGCLEDARHRGVEHLFYGQVDNPLMEVCDPELIGYHLWSRSEMTTQVVCKRESHDHVGNLVRIDGQMRMIEYSDLPEDVASQREPDGSLRLWAGNIAVHVFERSFLEAAAGEPETLPWHRARKATPCLDECGRLIQPTQPNTFKFERFIFDLLPASRRGIAVEADRAEAFAPIKNADGQGVNTPATARAAMVALHRRWLQEAGATVRSDVAVEISPLWALDSQEAARKIEPGAVIDEPRYFDSDDAWSPAGA